MVKVAIAGLAVAATGVALWLLLAWSSAPSETDSAVDSCVHGPIVECVGYRAPPAPTSEIPESCKAWLQDAASSALLARCLHIARRAEDSNDRARRRKSAIATSS